MHGQRMKIRVHQGPVKVHLKQEIGIMIMFPLIKYQSHITRYTDNFLSEWTFRKRFPDNTIMTSKWWKWKTNFPRAIPPLLFASLSYPLFDTSKQKENPPFLPKWHKPKSLLLSTVSYLFSLFFFDPSWKTNETVLPFTQKNFSSFHSLSLTKIFPTLYP